jgi:hypothetical protein
LARVVAQGALRLLEGARREGDRRVLRFFGEDDAVALAEEEVAWAEIVARQRRQREGAAARARL